jgi:hypothetical protein
MYTCNRCGRRITAEEAVIKTPAGGSGDNLILCSSCSARPLPVVSKNQSNPVLLKGIGLVLLAVIVGVIWFGLFFVTGYPWDFLSVLAGWGMGRLQLRFFPRKQTSNAGLSAILLTILVIAIREYLIFGTVNDFSTPPNGLWGLIIQPPAQVISAWMSGLTADPFRILMWLVSIWIAFVTVLGSSKPRKN